jgi:tRNA U34 5-methylaminomethyl-2-thiouridine-forming methyltransferase MnmC
MRKVLTKDSSFTLKNEELGETYHSVSGAFEEAFFKFVEPIKLKEGMVVFDICFGLGYNSAMLIHWYFEHFAQGLKLVGFEQDRAVLDQIQTIEVPEFIEPAYGAVRGWAKRRDLLRVIVGDARLKLFSVKEKANAVMLDPFSPRKAPELWQQPFLKSIYDRMHNGGVLTTYSCARIVRDNLKACGFRIKDGPCVGRRGPSTIAVK